MEINEKCWYIVLVLVIVSIISGAVFCNNRSMKFEAEGRYVCNRGYVTACQNFIHGAEDPRLKEICRLRFRVSTGRDLPTQGQW